MDIYIINDANGVFYLNTRIIEMLLIWIYISSKFIGKTNIIIIYIVQKFIKFKNL